MRRAASLKIDHVTKRFGGVIALNDVSFDVTQGEIHGLIGPNGAGKTTLFNLITGIYSPTEGKIELNGRSLVGMSPHQTANLGIARTFQNIRLFDELSVYQNLITACQKHLSYHLADGLFKTPKYRREEKEIAKLTETTLHRLASGNCGTNWRAICHTVNSEDWRLPERWLQTRNCCFSMSRLPE